MKLDKQIKMQYKSADGLSLLCDYDAKPCHMDRWRVVSYPIYYASVGVEVLRPSFGLSRRRYVFYETTVEKVGRKFHRVYVFEEDR
jgi:hypothetical protein